MQGTVAKFNHLQSKEKILKSAIQQNLKHSDINELNKESNNQLSSSLPAQIKTIVITQAKSSENMQNQQNNKQKENITRPAIKLKDLKPLVRKSSRSNQKQNKIIKFNSPQHTNLNNNILITQPPKIKRQGIITHVQPPSIIKASTMKNLYVNPQKLFKICEQGALDNIFLKSKDSIIRNAKVVQVQDLNDSLNFWKEPKK